MKLRLAAMAAATVLTAAPRRRATALSNRSVDGGRQKGDPS